MANVSSSNGLEKRPKLRFPGFDEPWKEIKIGDIFKVTRGNVLSSALVSSEKSNGYTYPVFSSQTKDDGLMGYYNEFLFEDAITWTTDGANAGTVHFRKGKFYCTNVCGVLLNSYGYANRCIAEILGRVSKRYVSYVGNPKLMNNVMSEICIYIPSLAEQSHIDDFLLVLDKKIEKQRQLVDSLKKYKRGVIQHIFRRSHGQTESQQWQQVRLGDIFKKVSRRNTDGKIKNVITNSAEYGLIPQRDFFDKDIAIEGNTENYYVIENGDFVYNPRKSITAPYGPFNRYTLKDQGIISPLYTCLVLKVNINPSYLAWYFKSDAWHRYIYDNGSQGVRHDRVSMTDDLLMGIPVIFPDRTTQDSIANALDLVENRLHLAQNKMDLLNMTRKGFMQQLFI